MKKLPYIIGIPAIAVALVLGGAMVWKLKMQTVDVVKNTGPMTLPEAVGNASGKKPSNPFGGLFGSSGQSSTTAIPTPTPASVAAMNAELNSIGDDGGTSDFTSLNTDVSGL